MCRAAQLTVKLFGVALAILLLFGPGIAQERVPGPREAVLLDVSGAIGPATTEYLRHGFKAAADRDARLVILRMDTPGGLDTATREIVRDILASPIPVVTYVSPSGARAASAGTYILYASHLAAMSPGTNLGAATPVQIGGGWAAGGAEVTAPRTTTRRLRPTRCPQSDQRRCRLHPGPRRPARPQRGMGGGGGARSGEPVGQGGSRKGVIEIVASDLDEVLRQAHGRSVRLLQEKVQLDTAGLAVVPIEPNWRTRLLAVITNPNIAFILMMVGIYGIIFEFMNPGTIFSGVIGAICLMIGLFALNLLPVNYAGIGLIGLGSPSCSRRPSPDARRAWRQRHLAFALGAIFLFEGDIPGFTLSPAVIVAATGVGAGLALLAGAGCGALTRPPGRHRQRHADRPVRRSAQLVGGPRRGASSRGALAGARRRAARSRAASPRDQA